MLYMYLQSFLYASEVIRLQSRRRLDALHTSRKFPDSRIVTNVADDCHQLCPAAKAQELNPPRLHFATSAESKS
jgi:hypothetical protein